MDYSPLSSLISSLERGTKLHICVTFFDNYGNRKTLPAYGQSFHSMPVCTAIKNMPGGRAACYRCRKVVRTLVARHRRACSGLCVHGVYEHCRPVIYDDRVICVIFVGNVLTDDPAQRRKLEKQVDSSLLETMEDRYSEAECAEIADILESYILLLFDRYGVENSAYDPLVENIKNYIQENLIHDFSMEDLATAFNYNSKYLGHVFKSRTGRSIRSYCNIARVNRAKELLADTKQGIADIALQVGFNSVAYFDRVFFKVTKLTPQQYRDALGKAK